MSTTMKKYAGFLHHISGKILLGCDGFVDETYEIVEVRKSQTEFTPMKNLRQFGELLVERADGGVGVELVPKRRCEGGFGINTGRVGRTRPGSLPGRAEARSDRDHPATRRHIRRGHSPYPEAAGGDPGRNDPKHPVEGTRGSTRGPRDPNLV